MYRKQFFFINIQLKKNNPSQMRKQENWKKYPYLFNQHKKLTFECECGKKYVSFPGLYLHSQRKHDHKISTKFDPQQCSVVQIDDKIIYKYSLNMKRTDQSNEKYADTIESEKQSISTVLSKFAEECSKKFNFRPYIEEKQDPRLFIEKIMVKFENFIFKFLSQGNSDQSSKQILSKAPNYFNQFMENIEAYPASKEYGGTCMILLKLSEWLRKEGHSNLIVELTQQQKQEGMS